MRKDHAYCLREDCEEDEQQCDDKLTILLIQMQTIFDTNRKKSALNQSYIEIQNMDGIVYMCRIKNK